MDIKMLDGTVYNAKDSVNNSEFVMMDVNNQKVMDITVKATRVIDSQQAFAIAVSFL